MTSLPEVSGAVCRTKKRLSIGLQSGGRNMRYVSVCVGNPTRKLTLLGREVVRVHQLPVGASSDNNRKLANRLIANYCATMRWESDEMPLPDASAGRLHVESATLLKPRLKAWKSRAKLPSLGA